MYNLKKETVIRYRKPFGINIGVVIFIIAFIYVVFNVFIYITKTHIVPYEVEQGTMAANNIYNGLVLREEKVYTSEYDGVVNYYVKEYSKVGFDNLIYSVDKNGSVADKLNEAKKDVAQISNEVTENIIKILGNFETSYNSKDFYKVYTLKDEINSLLNESLSMEALDQISDYVNTAEGNQTFHRVRAVEDGIVSYYVDGYESVTIDNFNADMLNESNYKRNNLKANAEIKLGDAVYKMINSEKWHIILPISTELAQKLKDDTLIRIRFVKDAKEMYAEYVIQQKGGSTFMILTMKNSMIRYASERYLEIELLMEAVTGLKIPNSAIVEKEFYTIPVECFLKGNDTEKSGLLLEKTDKDGNVTTEFIEPTIYYRTENFCYIDSEYVQAEENIIKPDSTEKYRIGNDTATLQGVYNINKGYAVFKQIEIMFQNEEYSIAAIGTDYGVALYDHIALDGSKIKEDELIK